MKKTVMTIMALVLFAGNAAAENVWICDEWHINNGPKPSDFHRCILLAKGEPQKAEFYSLLSKPGATLQVHYLEPTRVRFFVSVPTRDERIILDPR